MAAVFSLISYSLESREYKEMLKNLDVSLLSRAKPTDMRNDWLCNYMNSLKYPSFSFMYCFQQLALQMYTNMRMWCAWLKKQKQTNKQKSNISLNIFIVCFSKSEIHIFKSKCALMQGQCNYWKLLSSLGNEQLSQFDIW